MPGFAALSAMIVATQLMAGETQPAVPSITPPEAVLGARPGTDYFVADYTRISAWLRKVSHESDRKRLVSIGKTAQGRDQYMAVVSNRCGSDWSMSMADRSHRAGRWQFDMFEFPYRQVFPQELDRGGLAGRYDAIVLQSDVLGGVGNHVRAQPDAADIPAPFRPLLGRLTAEKTYPNLAGFVRSGGRLVALGAASRIGEALGLPVSDPLTERTPDGGTRPLPTSAYYVPGSLLSARIDPSQPLAYGMPERVDVFFNNSPVFAPTPDAALLKRVGWFDSETPLVAGWAWGQARLASTTAVLTAPLGKGDVDLIGPEATFRGQPDATFKLLFNALSRGAS